MFIFIKVKFTCNSLIIGFYTTFYLFNNIQLLLLFLYTISYLQLSKKTRDISLIINYSVFAFYIILDIVNIFTHTFFGAEDGQYVRTKLMIISQGYQFVAFAMVFILAMTNKKLGKEEKIAFSVYCILPFIAIVIQNFFPGYAIAYLSIIISIEILFLFINVRKNIVLADIAKRNKDAEVKIMMSQIQPHFIYNTLASISTLIEIDPKKAEKALDDFTNYLRANLSSLTETHLISFGDELRHIETYLSLEKMRFEERLNIVYDIKTKNFMVPPLSIQPIVENAVKHGILKKVEGGTIVIKTCETPTSYIVEVDDDGVGFVVSEHKKDDNQHVGLTNVESRLSSMCHGSMKIESEPNKGTKVQVTLLK